MKNLKLVLILTLLIGLFSCKKDDINNNNNNDTTLNRTVKNIMDEWYLWYDKMPTVNVDSFTNPQDLVDALKYKTLDRWSFIITEDEYNQYLVEGTYYGHGMDYAFGTDNKLRATLVYKSSEQYKAGVRRGWIIKKINETVPTSNNIKNLWGENKAGIQNTFQFTRPGNTDTIISFTKTLVKMDMIIENDTLHVGNKIVGYIVLKGFISDAEQEVANVFSTFKQQGVTDLIVDLRYNGGGWIDDAAKMGALITGANAENGVICKLIHNDKKIAENFDVTMEPNANALNLNRVFFITSRATASASELLINGMKPFIDVKIIGSATDGKPVGMYKQDLKEFKYVFFPIMFKTVNKNDEGDYYNGIPVDKETIDDITHDFGDRNEACLFQALHYIEKGSFAATVKSHIGAIDKPLSDNWWDQIFGVY
jgi:carboxyl-terminal processing protease